jgi:hypothetical protein
MERQDHDIHNLKTLFDAIARLDPNSKGHQGLRDSLLKFTVKRFVKPTSDEIITVSGLESPIL